MTPLSIFAAVIGLLLILIGESTSVFPTPILRVFRTLGVALIVLFVIKLIWAIGQEPRL